MTAACTWDVLSSVDGFGSYDGGYRATQGPE
jgi:hypothetical protein